MISCMVTEGAGDSDSDGGVCHDDLPFSVSKNAAVAGFNGETVTSVLSVCVYACAM